MGQINVRFTYGNILRDSLSKVNCKCNRISNECEAPPIRRDGEGKPLAGEQPFCSRSPQLWWMEILAVKVHLIRTAPGWLNGAVLSPGFPPASLLLL